MAQQSSPSSRKTRQERPTSHQRRGSARIFVSYSHQDRAWLDKLQVVLAPLLRGQPDLILWDDTRIAPGEQWRVEIERELRAASVAVLLVSQRFLASRFIAENELPPLLHRAKAQGVRILWIPIGACLYQESPLTDFQAAWDPSHPLNSLKGPQQEHALVLIAQAIKDSVVSPSTVATGGNAHGAALLSTITGDSTADVQVVQDWYAIPWSDVIGKASSIECAVSYMDTWINNAASALEDFFGRGGTLRFFLPMPGSPAAERVVERFPEYDLAVIESKIKNTRSKLRALQRGNGKLEVRWTDVFNMHCLMLLDDCVLLVSPYDHFRNNRIQNPSFAVPLWKHPIVASWIGKEFKGFLAASSTRISSRRLPRTDL